MVFWIRLVKNKGHSSVQEETDQEERADDEQKNDDVQSDGNDHNHNGERSGGRDRIDDSNFERKRSVEKSVASSAEPSINPDDSHIFHRTWPAR